MFIYFKLLQISHKVSTVGVTGLAWQQLGLIAFYQRGAVVTVMLGGLGDNVTVLAVECNFPPLSPQLCGSDTAGARRVTSREKSTEAEREKKHQQEEELFPANKAE